MELSAIFHDMSKRYCFALKKGEIAIRIKTKKNDVSKVIIHTKDKYLDIHGIETEQEFLMQKVASDTINDYYEIALTIDVICLRYFFELVDFEGQTIFYGNYEFYSEKITSRDKMYDCPQNLREEEEFLIPEWAPNKIVYQIFRHALQQQKMFLVMFGIKLQSVIKIIYMEIYGELLII